MDTGASATAGPEASVTAFCQALLREDPSAQFHVDYTDACRPSFRFGNGKLGRALFLVKIVSSKGRSLLMFALPDPPPTSTGTSMPPVPLLIGMPFLGPNRTIIDLGTG